MSYDCANAVVAQRLDKSHGIADPVDQGVRHQVIVVSDGDDTDNDDVADNDDDADNTDMEDIIKDILLGAGDKSDDDYDDDDVKYLF